MCDGFSGIQLFRFLETGPNRWIPSRRDRSRCTLLACRSTCCWPTARFSEAVAEDQVGKTATKSKRRLSSSTFPAVFIRSRIAFALRQPIRRLQSSNSVANWRSRCEVLSSIFLRHANNYGRDVCGMGASLSPAPTMTSPACWRSQWTGLRWKTGNQPAPLPLFTSPPAN